jgi:hypothetical protein
MKTRTCPHSRIALLALVAAAVLAAVPALAQDVIPHGTDSWTTAGDGSSYTDLSLPAGFLDPNCDAFSGRVILAGVPIVTSPPNAFNGGDTLVERLDDAVFDAKGTATTNIIVRGLHFQGTAPLKTACGDWTADVGLDKQQSTTQMTIVRQDSSGGYFTAPISVNTVWTFTRSGDGAVRTLSTSNVLTSSEQSPWQAGTCTKSLAVKQRTALVDAGNHGKPSLKIASVSVGFNPGYGPNCRPVVLCRGKMIDPSIHCYSPAVAAPGSTF